VLRMILWRFGLRGAKYFEFVQVLRRSASSLRFSVGVRHCTSTRNVVNENTKTFWHRLRLPIRGTCTLSNMPNSAAEDWFPKNWLDNYFSECYMSKYSKPNRFGTLRGESFGDRGWGGCTRCFFLLFRDRLVRNAACGNLRMLGGIARIVGRSGVTWIVGTSAL